MEWKPQPDQLSQLTQFLRDSLSGKDAAAQRKAGDMLQKAKSNPDINNYLVFISVTTTNPTQHNKETWFTARSAGAILLKNNVKTGYPSIPEQSKAYVKAHLPAGLQDPNTQIRNFIGNVITEIVRQAGIAGWPELLPSLVSVIDNSNGQPSLDAQDGAMSALFKICEDNKLILDDAKLSPRPLSDLLPKLLNFTKHPDPRIRWKALSAVNVFLNDPVAFTARERINDILPRIVALTTDGSEDVRRFVCRSFSLLADGMPDVLIPNVQGIVDYTVSQQKEIQNPELALDAAEFFYEASKSTALRDALGPQLDKIAPVLLDCMIYSEDDQVRLEADNEDDAELEDREEDIKPQFAAVKSGRMGLPGTNGATTNAANGQAQSSINGYAYEDDELSEGEIDEENDLGGSEGEWNLRKCSAAALDNLALHFGAPVFSVTIPWLMNNLQHKDWQNREAAVLALGAIGPGCMDDIKPHLPQLIPYMTTLLTDQQPVVRQITCWALSRFAGWASQLDNAGKKQLFVPMMDGILQRMLDNNKTVQESAASAFATLEEDAKGELIPYCQVILQQFVKCFEQYKDKNIYLLYDCVQTLTEHAGQTLAQPELVNLIMPALIARWQKVQDRSREMFPLLECLAFIASALGAQFAPYAEPFFTRSIKIIHQNLEEGATAESDSWLDQPDKDFLVTSLDLLSAIIQVLSSEQSAELAKTAQPNMVQLLAYCMKDVNDDVKQSAYALLGDFAIYVYPQLQPYLPTMMELVIAQLDLTLAENVEDPETVYRVINNACWSCGEIAMREGPGMARYIDRVLQKLAIIMFSETAPESLTENAAIALGRLGIECHQQLAPHLQNFALPFLNAMQKVGWTDEKGHAYRGFCHVVLDNPQAMQNGLLDLFSEMANAPGLFLTGMQDEGPLKLFERVLAGYKQLMGDQFDNYLHNLPPPQEQALRQLYIF